MIIDDENFKNKVIDELSELNKRPLVRWKSISEDENDYMANITYTYRPNPKRNEIKKLSFGYRVCCFGNIPRIIIYDYLYKNGVTDTSDMPSIEFIDTSIKNSNIYKLLEEIKELVNKQSLEKDEQLLDKFTWYLNNKKKKDN